MIQYQFDMIHYAPITMMCKIFVGFGDARQEREDKRDEKPEPMIIVRKRETNLEKLLEEYQ